MQNRYNSKNSLLNQIKKITISNKIFNNHLLILKVSIDNLVKNTIINKMIKDKLFSYCKLNLMEKSNLIIKPLILLPLIMIGPLALQLWLVNTELVKVFYLTNYFSYKKRNSKSNNILMHVLKVFGCGPIHSLINTLVIIFSLLVTYLLFSDTEGLASL